MGIGEGDLGESQPVEFCLLCGTGVGGGIAIVAITAHLWTRPIPVGHGHVDEAVCCTGKEREVGAIARY